MGETGELAIDVGSTADALLEETIGQNLARTVAEHGDVEALVSCHQGIRWTYREFAERVAALARGLMSAGLAAGDRVGMWSPNYAEWTLVQYATAEIGVILVNINPAYRSHELAYALQHSGCRLLIAAPSFKTSDYRAIVEEVRADCRDLESVVFLWDPAWDDLAEGGATTAAALAERRATLAADDAINIQYTSGTTGYPKGATLSHRNILNNGRFVAAL
ncbi:MAG: AMP-binding protein, partial [Ilumatobacteraceae bacterium]